MTRTKTQPKANGWFTANRSDLMGYLGRLQLVAVKGNTIPILTSVLLETSKGELKMTATDMDVTLFCSCPAETEEEFSMAVNSSLLHNVITKAPEGSIGFSIEGSRLRITYPGAEMNLGFYPKTEYPSVNSPESGEITIPSVSLARMIRRSMPGIGKEESRYALLGVQFRQKNGFEMCGTNGEHLALATEPGESAAFCFTIPRKALTALAALLKDVEEPIPVGESENLLRFDLPGGVLTARKLAPPFPRIDGIFQSLKTSAAFDFDLDTAKTIEAVRRVCDFADGRTRHVRLRFDKNVLEVSYNYDPDRGDGKVTLPIEYAGEELLIGLNFQYLLDALGAVDSERYTMKAGDGLPVVIESAGYQGLIVPIQPNFV